MKSKSLLLILLLVVVILGGLYYSWVYRKPQTADSLSKVTLSSGDALILIDFSGLKPERFFVGKVVEGMTLLDAFKVAAAAGNLDVQFGGQGGNEKVVKIDGLGDTTGGVWHYYRFSTPVNQPLSAQLVSPGDRFKFVYEK